jgi:hypothetical protein
MATGRWCASASPSVSAKRASGASNSPAPRSPRATHSCCAWASKAGAPARAVRANRGTVQQASFALTPSPGQRASQPAKPAAAPRASTASGTRKERPRAPRSTVPSANRSRVPTARSVRCPISQRGPERSGWSASSAAAKDFPPAPKTSSAMAGSASHAVIHSSRTCAARATAAASADQTAPSRVTRTGSAQPAKAEGPPATGEPS